MIPRQVEMGLKTNNLESFSLFVWHDKGFVAALIRALLFPFSLLYGFVIGFRNLLYDTKILSAHSLGVPVASIGNIAVGGTGKTPFCIALVTALRQKGYYPAILTRGYGVPSARVQGLVLLDKKIIFDPQFSGADPPQIPDEAMLMSARLPHTPIIIGRDRISAWHNFCKNTEKSDGKEMTPVTHVIMDDGFQHRRIARSLDVVLIDTRRGLGALLPVGFLRESSRALKRAHLLIATGDDPEVLMNYFSKIFPQKEAFALKPVPSKIVDAFSGKELDMSGTPVLLVTGVAQPGGVRGTLDRMGITILGQISYADHEPFDFEALKKEMLKYQTLLESDSDHFKILTTSKDFWRQSEGLAKFQGALALIDYSFDLGNLNASDAFQKFLFSTKAV